MTCKYLFGPGGNSYYENRNNTYTLSICGQSKTIDDAAGSGPCIWKNGGNYYIAHRCGIVRNGSSLSYPIGIKVDASTWEAEGHKIGISCDTVGDMANPPKWYERRSSGNLCSNCGSALAWLWGWDSGNPPTAKIEISGSVYDGTYIAGIRPPYDSEHYSMEWYFSRSLVWGPYQSPPTDEYVPGCEFIISVNSNLDETISVMCRFYFIESPYNHCTCNAPFGNITCPVNATTSILSTNDNAWYCYVNHQMRDDITDITLKFE